MSDAERAFISTTGFFTDPYERVLAENGCISQAAVRWKRRTGADLEEARRMKKVFRVYNLRYWGAIK